jgi:hypothetical protein
MEVDDVQLSAREEYALEVEPGGVLVAGSDETLLRIPLPEGAEDVRFSSDAVGLGLVRLEDGAIGVRGPLQPGRHAVGVAWRLRTGEDGVRFERSFDRRLPLLRTYVADTGVAVETDRLHRRRPVLDADRTYLVYEAFELEPDRPVAFSLRALPPRGGGGRATTVAALGLGLVALAFLLAPLQRRETPGAGGAEEAPDATAEERDAVFQGIRDLDHDHETGKLSESDWQAMRSELKARAVALLKTEQERAARPRPGAGPGAEGSERPAGAGEAAPTCDACGATGRPGDRFCARCGRQLGAPAA